MRPSRFVFIFVFTLVIAIFILTAQNTRQAETPLETASSSLAQDDWPTNPRFDFHFDALNPLSQAGDSASSDSLYDPEDEFWGLPRTPGYELIDVYCSGCHSLEIVMQQRADASRWRYMLNWMVEEQNMAPLLQEDADIVLNYLVTHFGPN